VAEDAGSVAGRAEEERSVEDKEGSTTTDQNSSSMIQ
jgi:hypothetical protein